MHEGVVYGKTESGAYRQLRVDDSGALLTVAPEAVSLIREAVVALDSTTIVDDGSGNVTGWTNAGTGGSAFNLSKKVGEMLLGSYAGRKTVEVQAGGTLGVESPQVLSGTQGYTVVCVGRLNIVGSNQFYWGNAEGTGTETLSYFQVNATPVWRQIIGTTGMGAVTPDLDLHIHGFSSSSLARVLYLDDAQPETGAIRTNDWSYGSIGSNYGGGTTREGGFWIGEFYVWDRELDADEIAALVDYLKPRWEPTAEQLIAEAASDWTPAGLVGNDGDDFTVWNDDKGVLTLDLVTGTPKVGTAYGNKVFDVTGRAGFVRATPLEHRGPYTVMAVGQCTGAIPPLDGNYGVLSGYLSTPAEVRYVQRILSTSWSTFIGGTDGAVSSTIPGANNNPFVWGASNPIGTQIIDDTTETSANTSEGINLIRVGSGDSSSTEWDGWVGRVLFWPRALNADEMQTVTAKLREEWDFDNPEKILAEAACHYDETTIQTSGGVVTGYANKGTFGNGVDLVQFDSGTGIKEAPVVTVNGMEAVDLIAGPGRVDGAKLGTADDAFTTENPYTTIVVASTRMFGSASGYALQNRIGIQGGIVARRLAGELGTYSGTWQDSSLILGNDLNVLAIKHTTDAVCWRNNDSEVVGDAGSEPRRGLLLGGVTNSITAADWDGVICELAVFTRLLSDAEMGIVIDYLKAKWGIS